MRRSTGFSSSDGDGKEGADDITKETLKVLIVSTVKRELRAVGVAMHRAKSHGAAMPLETSNFKTEVANLLARKDFAAMKTKLATWLPADVAPTLAELPIEQLA